jgi:hypothetical protein
MKPKQALRVAGIGLGVGLVGLLIMAVDLSGLLNGSISSARGVAAAEDDNDPLDLALEDGNVEDGKDEMRRPGEESLSCFGADQERCDSACDSVGRSAIRRGCSQCGQAESCVEVDGVYMGSLACVDCPTGEGDKEHHKQGGQ